MIRLAQNNKRTVLLCAIGVLCLASFAIAGEMKDGASAGANAKNQIVIKDFHFNPVTLTVKSGEKITWINRDDEPHTVVSVEKQFKKSAPLDTDQEFTVIAGAPGTYTYYCSVHPKMTGTIIVAKPL